MSVGIHHGKGLLGPNTHTGCLISFSLPYSEDPNPLLSTTPKIEPVDRTKTDTKILVIETPFGRRYDVCQDPSPVTPSFIRWTVVGGLTRVFV